jgi:hypothetical protein
MAKVPKHVEVFHKAMRRLVAVKDVWSGLSDLASYTPDTYSFPGEFGDLPHALLRRTEGGKENEVWLHTEFELSPNKAGWLTLEFLAWWVRELSRGGEQIQLRPMALPPRAFQVQLGRTLKFIIDQFVICAPKSNKAALKTMQDRAASLNDSIDGYADVLGSLIAGRDRLISRTSPPPKPPPAM